MRMYLLYLKNLFSGEPMYNIGRFKLIVASLITIFLGNFFIQGVGSFFTTDNFDLEHESKNIHQGVDTVKLLYFLILVPILEEISFRLFLNGRKRDVGISFSLMSGYLLTGIILNTYLPNSYSELMLKIVLFFPFFSFASFTILFNILGVNAGYLDDLTKAVQQKRRFFYYFSSLLFGLMHPLYAVLSNQSLALVIISFLSISFIGLIYAFVRLSLGIKYSIIIHLLYNALSFLPPI